MKRSTDKGCQIFLGTKYLNRKNIPNGRKKYQMATKILNGPKIDETAIKYTNIFHGKTPQNLPKFVFFV
jgi:hypothetical protein